MGARKLGRATVRRPASLLGVPVIHLPLMRCMARRTVTVGRPSVGDGDVGSGQGGEFAEP